MAGRQAYQSLVTTWIESHARNNAYAQAHVHVGLDDVRIDGLQYDIGRNASGGKYFIQRAPPRKRMVVGHNRVFGQLLEGNGLGGAGGQLSQRMKIGRASWRERVCQYG